MSNYRQTAAKWYRSSRWQSLRARRLAANPWCQCPHHINPSIENVKANVVDHIIPHRGDPRLMWDYNNLQSMLRRCHDKFKQSQEKGGAGFLQGCDKNGLPLSAEHEWNN